MDLYFAPLACSLACRMALYEAGIDVQLVQVVLATKRLADGADYREVNLKGQVPALRNDDGVVLTEVPAVLQYIADLAPESGLAPPTGTIERYRLQQWLNYIGTEVHKAVFYMVFNPASPAEVRAFAREGLLPARYDYLVAHLADREFLLDRFGVADAYLATTLNWAAPAEIDLARWPILADYHQRVCARPAIARAISEERALSAAS